MSDAPMFSKKRVKAMTARLEKTREMFRELAGQAKVVGFKHEQERINEINPKYISKINSVLTEIEATPSDGSYLKCGHCGEEYNHIEEIVLFSAGDDESAKCSTVFVDIEGSMALGPALHQPVRAREPGLLVGTSCECCAKVTWNGIFFHKGMITLKKVLDEKTKTSAWYKRARRER